MSKKFRLLMVLVLVTGLLGGLLSGSTVSADPNPGQVIEIPRIDLRTAFVTGAGWGTRIQVLNPSLTSDAYVTAVFWKKYSGYCPSNSPGPFYHTCMKLQPNGVWTMQGAIPAGAMSAIIYSFPSAATWKCTNSSWDYDTWAAAATGPDLAVTVDRWGTDPFGEFEIASSYTGVADPEMASGALFAPYIMHGYQNLDTVITIQNSGEYCTSIWIYYKEEDNCEFMKAQHIEQIAPGESVTVGPAGFADYAFPSPELDAPWLGSAYISANADLAVIVDQLSLTDENVGTLLTMRGMPWSEGDTVWYADLLYREISGWTSSIQVQNLTIDSQPTFVTVDFFDQSGDEILYVGDWVCRNGAKTFYLPAITDLGVNYPFGYVGAAEIESHPQVDYPGGMHYGEPIFAVVDIKKTKVYDESLPGWRHTVAGETQGGAYNAHPYWQKVYAWLWAMPHIAKEQAGVTSRIAIRNNANCNKIQGNIYIKDETGIVSTIPVPWLDPKHMKVFDLAYFGTIVRGFVGAAEFWVTGVEQLCDVDADGITDQLPVMPSVVVLNYGFATELPIGSGAGPQTTEGDLTRVYEAIPYGLGYVVCDGSLFGTVTVRQENSGFDRPEINDVLVAVDDLSDITDSTGAYQIKDVDEGKQTVTASKSGFFDGEEEAVVECGKATLLDFELVCAVSLFATVEDTAGNRLPGATVTALSTYDYNADKEEGYTTEGETDNAGEAEFDVAGADILEVTASADGHDDADCVVRRNAGVGICYDSWTAGCELCKWATAVGTIQIAGELAAGYTVKLLNMTTLEWADTDVTTAAGVFSVENLSVADGPIYRLYLYNTSGTLISTTGDITLASPANCGDTLALCYVNGAWIDCG
jgi:hypothetical protein